MMNHSMDGIGWCFENLDRLRRLHGHVFDSLGLGPGERAHRTVFSRPALRLRLYGPGRPGQPALLIVPAPIKRFYIWDLSARRSVVRQALARGLEVYLCEWTEPDGRYGLEQYVGILLDQCVQAIVHATGKDVFLAGHSLGGTLAALYAAYQPRRIAGLILIEAPLHFANAAGVFGKLLDSGIPADAILPASDCVPGSLLSLIGASAAPATFCLERYLDYLASLASHQDLETHWRVVRWTLDELPLPRQLFDDVVDQLYRQDRFMRGELVIGGRRISPHDIHAPMFAVYEPDSSLIPAAAIVEFHRAAGSMRKTLVPYEGDVGIALKHVGALVGTSAHREIWPRALAWIERQSYR
jgi:polyhydroxyalkanoate synthase